MVGITQVRELLNWNNLYLKNLNRRCLLYQKSELSHPQPKYCLTPRLYQANVINTSQNKPRKVGGRKGRCVGYYGSPRGPYLLRIKWKNQDIQYYSVKGLGGRHFNSCILVLWRFWGQLLVSSLSDQFRRLFSGTLGLLPIVFPNRDQGGTLVHFWRDCPRCS